MTNDVWYFEEPEHEQPWGLFSQVGYVCLLAAASVVLMVCWRRK